MSVMSYAVAAVIAACFALGCRRLCHVLMGRSGCCGCKGCCGKNGCGHCGEIRNKETRPEKENGK